MDSHRATHESSSARKTALINVSGFFIKAFNSSYCACRTSVSCKTQSLFHGVPLVPFTVTHPNRRKSRLLAPRCTSLVSGTRRLRYLYLPILLPMSVTEQHRSSPLFHGNAESRNHSIRVTRLAAYLPLSRFVFDGANDCRSTGHNGTYGVAVDDAS